jgi:uncharacterized protein YggE
MPRFATLLFCLSSVCIGHQHTWGQARGNYLKKQATDNYANAREANMQQVSEEGSFNTSYYLNDTTLLVASQVLYNAKPSDYVALFSLTQVASSADSVNRLMNERLDGFRRGLTALGIPESDVFVDMISLEAKYETQLERKAFSKRAVEVPAGFELAKNVHVRYRNESLIHGIVAAAVGSEIYDLVKVDYFVPNLEAIYDTLQRTAAALIERKKTAFQTVDVRFEPAYSALMDERRNAYYPVELYAAYVSSSRTSLEVVKKGKITVLPERITSSFYDKPSYTAYDQVFNPVVLEPRVHISYGLRVRYIIRKAELAPKPAGGSSVPGLSIQPGQLIIVPSGSIGVPGGR